MFVFSPLAASAALLLGVAGQYSIECAPGTYTVTGQSAELVYQPQGITRLGTYVFQSSEGYGNQSISIPSDCDYILLCAVYYSGAGIDLTFAKINGVSLAKIVDSNDNAAFGYTTIWGLANPSTGSQTFEWNWQAALSEGAHFCFVFLKGVDSTSPTRDEDRYLGGGSSGSFVLDTQANDYCIIVAYGFQDADVNCAPTGSGQTEIIDTDRYNNCQGSVGEEVATGSSTTLSFDNGTYSTASGVALVPAGAPSGYILTASGGSYSLSGQAASLLAARLLEGQAGDYTVSGQAAGTFLARKIQAESAGYSLSGEAAGLLAARLLTIEPGDYAVSGQAVDLLFGRKISIEAGSYSLAGQAVGVLFDRKIISDSGSYAISGQDIGLLFDRLISAGSGSYLVTGSDVDLIYFAGYILIASPGTYSLSGQEVGIVKQSKILAEPGIYSLSGQQAGTLYLRRIFPSEGSYLISGQEANVLYERLLAASAGAYSIIGSDVDFIKLSKILAETGEYILGGRDAELIWMGYYRLILRLISRLSKEKTFASLITDLLEKKSKIEKELHLKSKISTEE